MATEMAGPAPRAGLRQNSIRPKSGHANSAKARPASSPPRAEMPASINVAPPTCDLDAQPFGIGDDVVDRGLSHAG